MSMATSLITEGVSTAVPSRVTDPQLSCKVSVPEVESDKSRGILQTRMHIVLRYEKRSDDNGDFGWYLGGWIKESLGKALVKDPILAGRLARTNDEGGLEIVSNDSGVRVVEAQIPLSLEEFLECEEKDRVETELVSWNDVDENNLISSPLFYIQVTNFKCGGYSVGISYSLLLTDPFHMAKFLNLWAEIHRSTAYDGEISKTPFFYAPNFAKRVGCPSPPTTTTSNPSGETSKTALFNISIEEKIDSGSEICKHLVLLCIDEAEGKFGLKMGLDFALITKEPNGHNKVEKVPKQSSFGSSKSLKFELSPLSWDDLGTNKIAFRSDNLPVEVSHWVACKDLEGVVLTVISSPREGEFGMEVYITFPGANSFS